MPSPVRNASIAYERHAPDYPRHRRADPRIAARVRAGLGDARTVLNVTAGSIAALAAAFALVAPGVASATIHTGRILFPEPHNPPSIGVPPPPAVQAKESTCDGEMVTVDE